MGAPDYDLLPVPAVHQVLLLLRDILDTHDGAMASRSNAQEEFQQARNFRGVIILQTSNSRFSRMS